MTLFGRPAFFSGKSRELANSQKRHRRGKPLDSRRRLVVERLEGRMVLSAVGGAANPNETIDTTLTPTELAQSLVGTGVSISNAKFTGGVASTGSFRFVDPAVLGFREGILFTSGSAVPR